MNVRLIYKKTRPYVLAVFSLFILFLLTPTTSAVTNPDSGSIGLEGTVSAEPPTSAPVITSPSNNQVFTETPITVTGTCEGDVIIHIYKNGVFSGAAECINGSFELQIDLFSGANDLIARAYDALGQSSPDSATVSIEFNDADHDRAHERISLMSNYARRGANPGEELIWPVIISGGIGPYTITVDWGDGSGQQEIDVENPGEVDLIHVYDRAGSYIVVVTAEDQNGDIALLQLVGIANGAIIDTEDEEETEPETIVESVRIPFLITVAVILVLAFTSFWLGKKHGLHILRKKLK